VSPSQLPFDPVPRTPENEARLDYLVERALTTEDGAQLLAYLKSITINQVLSPDASDQRLRAQEGARGVVALLQSRMQRAEQRRKDQPKE